MFTVLVSTLFDNIFLFGLEFLAFEKYMNLTALIATI